MDIDKLKSTAAFKARRDRLSKLSDAEIAQDEAEALVNEGDVKELIPSAHLQTLEYRIERLERLVGFLGLMATAKLNLEECRRATEQINLRACEIDAEYDLFWRKR